jgi:hypothetical protein
VKRIGLSISVTKRFGQFQASHARSRMRSRKREFIDQAITAAETMGIVANGSLPFPSMCCNASSAVLTPLVIKPSPIGRSDRSWEECRRAKIQLKKRPRF